jgi:hypothetical protein
MKVSTLKGLNHALLFRVLPKKKGKCGRYLHLRQI